MTPPPFPDSPNSTLPSADVIICPSTRGSEHSNFPNPKSNSEPLQLPSVSCFNSACGLFNLLIVGRNKET